MSFIPAISTIANASASLVGVITVGLVTMKFIFRNHPKFSISKRGKYPVAAFKGCRIKPKAHDQFTVQFQIFYPCVVGSNSHDGNELSIPKNIYMRQRAVEGLCRSLQMGRFLNFLLKCVLNNKEATHLINGFSDSVSALNRPNAEVNHKQTSQRKWPTVIFSHGLFGSMEEYSTICREIASHGFVVVAPEHEDGSASYAEKANSHENKEESNRKPDQTEVIIANAEKACDSCKDTDEYFTNHVIPYTRPVGVIYKEKESVVNFRRPFLLKRCKELNDLIFALAELASNCHNADSHSNFEAEINKQLTPFEKTRLNQVLLTTSLAETDIKSIILAGHSFGAANVLCMCDRLCGDNKNTIHNVRVTSLLLLDTWVSPVPDEILSRRLNIPTMSIFCETFVTWKPSKTPHELNGVEKMLKCNNHEIEGSESNKVFECVAIRGTEHQFFADPAYWFPKWMAKVGHVSGQTDVEISRSCLEKIIVQFLLKPNIPSELELTDKEKTYVYNVNEEMLNPPRQEKLKVS